MARREFFGLFYDPATKLVYGDDTSTVAISPFTFEDAQFTSTYPGGQPSRPLSFVYTPTQDTANKVFAWAKGIVGWHACLVLKQEPLDANITGTWNFPEWAIYAILPGHQDLAVSEPLNVGLIANNIIRSGSNPTDYAARALMQELHDQGAWVS